MGILNVTPDSFSDGGLFLDANAAVAHGLDLVRQGAHILDVGGESTRPGALPVEVGEELRRVIPVIERLAEAGVREGRRGGQQDGSQAHVQEDGSEAPVQISIDTSKAAVSRAALAAGATLVNDVTALRGDPQMVEALATSGADCCLMHMLGSPRTMQHEPRYDDVVSDVKAFLEERLAFAVRAGIAEERILLDPGIGFGKTVAHNLQLLRRLGELVALGRPVVVGTSRKSFLGRLASRARSREHAFSDESADGLPNRLAEPATADSVPSPQERLPGTIATNVLALERGASVFRVHDVAPVAAALRVAAATLAPTWTPPSTTTTTSPRS
jgi:dihydropteroate synthase